MTFPQTSASKNVPMTYPVVVKQVRTTAAIAWDASEFQSTAAHTILVPAPPQPVDVGQRSVETKRKLTAGVQCA